MRRRMPRGEFTRYVRSDLFYAGLEPICRSSVMSRTADKHLPSSVNFLTIERSTSKRERLSSGTLVPWKGAKKCFRRPQNWRNIARLTMVCSKHASPHMADAHFPMQPAIPMHAAMQTVPKPFQSGLCCSNISATIIRSHVPNARRLLRGVSMCARAGFIYLTVLPLSGETLKNHMKIHDVDRELFPCNWPGCTKVLTSVGQSTTWTVGYANFHESR